MGNVDNQNNSNHTSIEKWMHIFWNIQYVRCTKLIYFRRNKTAKIIELTRKIIAFPKLP